jgi:hypothetical protein
MDETKKQPPTSLNQQPASQNTQMDSIPDTETAPITLPATAAQLQQAETNIEQRMSAFEHSMVRLTTYGLVVTIFTGIIFLGQLYEMYQGGTATDRLVGYAKAQANAADNISQSSEDFTDSAHWMEEHMHDAASAMEKSNSQAQGALEKTLRQSKSTLDATIAASRLDQRAWVGIGLFRVIQFEKDKPFKIDIEIKNSGKTPALQMMESVKYGQDFSSRPGPRDEWFTAIMQPAEAVPPQGSHTIHLEMDKDALAPIFDELKAKTRLLYIIGTLDYKTISNETGFTEFCLVMVDSEKPELGFCGSHNNMK